MHQLWLGNKTKIFGEGGQTSSGNFNMNVMQMHYGTFNIQNYSEVNELRDIWKYVQSFDNDDEIKFKN